MASGSSLMDWAESFRALGERSCVFASQEKEIHTFIHHVAKNFEAGVTSPGFLQ